MGSMLACDLSSSILSAREKDSLYTVAIESGERPFADGALVAPGSALAATISRVRGSSDPGLLTIAVRDSAGNAVADYAYATDAARGMAAGAAARSVSALSGEVPAFSLPADLAPGAYVMTVGLSDPSGGDLQESEILFFAGTIGPSIDAVSLYPPSVEPGAAVLLAASIASYDLASPSDPAGGEPDPVSAAPAPEGSSAGSPSAQTPSASGRGLLQGDITAPEADPSAEAGESAVSGTPGEASSGAAEPTATGGENPAGLATIPEASAADGQAVGGGTSVAPPQVAAPAAAAVETAAPQTAPTSVAATSVATIPVATVSPTIPDYWIRWSRERIVFAEGKLADGYDRIVWTAPRTEGAYSLSVEVFPAPPPSGVSFDFKSSTSQDFKVMVKAVPGGSADDFSDPLRFHSLLKFDGGFEDSGVRQRNSQPQPFGSPILDVYPGGFGYRFHGQAGVRLAGLMPPASAGRLGSFSVSFKLDPEGVSGSLARFASDDGAWALALGLKDGRPYAEIAADGRSSRSAAVVSVGREPMTLTVSFRPDGERLVPTWFADGTRIEAPSLPLPSAPPRGGAQIGGAGSLPGIYDAFGLMAQAAPPSYRLAAKRQWKGDLVLAEGFDDWSLPPSSASSGTVSAAGGSLALEPDSSLTLAPAFEAAGAYRVEAGFDGDLASASLRLVSGTADLAVLRATGEILDAGGRPLGYLGGPAGELALRLEVGEGGALLLAGAAASPIKLAGAGGAISVVLSRTDGEGKLSVERVLVRRSSD